LTDLGLAAAVATAASIVLCRAMMEAGLVDMPGAARKAHRQPTPTSGGVGAAAGFALGMLALSLLPDFRANFSEDIGKRLFGVTAFVCGFGALGLYDDVRPLGPRTKFAMFVIGSVASAALAAPVQTLPLSDDLVITLPYWLGLGGSALWVFTLVNAVNFMDGSNGLSMGSVAVGLIGLALVSIAAPAPGAAALALLGAASLMGFLLWNFPSGRLFAGDSGALFAGALAALASLVAIQEGGVSPFVPPLLFFPVLADVLLTLAWRVRQKRKILAGHAEHIYQIIIRGGSTHASVALIYWGVTAVCAIVALIAQWAGSFAPPVALAVAAILSLAASHMTRRFAKARDMGEV
jgi:UDP-N-acetylmuramyl pentapeptide phosphotransferase/UDP-N-acetylglucosamine-1-phosphate transferase